MFEQLHQAHHRGMTARSAMSTRWMPRVNLSESADAFHLHVDLPGVAESDIDVSVEQGVLRINGRRGASTPAQAGAQRNLLRECPQGEFRRDFSLPESADITAVDASLSQGVLTVRIGKRRENEPRRIRIDH